MISLAADTRIWLACGVTDLRILQDSSRLDWLRIHFRDSCLYFAAGAAIG